MKLLAAMAAVALCAVLLAGGREDAGVAPEREWDAVAAIAIVDEPDTMPEGEDSSGTWGSVTLAVDDDAEERAGSDAALTVRVLDGGVVRVMRLDDYLAGVVAAEMPPSFPTAALEAQAVAARSLVHYRYGEPRHDGAEVCTDSGCCMAFGEENEKSRAAVAATDDCVATYEGEAIMAAFFASCDGSTRSAEEVWGAEVPYLVPVASGESVEAKGHGVGLSQYGAKAMAERGAGWREIVEHYYKGAEV